MDIALFIVAGLLILTGIAGCFLPVIPGPPIGYIGLLLVEFTSTGPFSAQLLIAYALLVVLVSVLDYFVPIWGAKYSGGSKYGTWGSTIGLVVGLFLGPLGIIAGPFVGAVIGEMVSGKDIKSSLKAGWGTFLGFMAGIILKLAVTIAMAYHIIIAAIETF